MWDFARIGLQMPSIIGKSMAVSMGIDRQLEGSIEWTDFTGVAGKPLDMTMVLMGGLYWCLHTLFLDDGF